MNSSKRKGFLNSGVNFEENLPPLLLKKLGKEPQNQGLLPEGHTARQTQLDPAIAGKEVWAPAEVLTPTLREKDQGH